LVPLFHYRPFCGYPKNVDSIFPYFSGSRDLITPRISYEKLVQDLPLRAQQTWWNNKDKKSKLFALNLNLLDAFGPYNFLFGALKSSHEGNPPQNTNYQSILSRSLGGMVTEYLAEGLILRRIRPWELTLKSSRNGLTFGTQALKDLLPSFCFRRPFGFGVLPEGTRQNRKGIFAWGFPFSFLPDVLGRNDFVELIFSNFPSTPSLENRTRVLENPFLALPYYPLLPGITELPFKKSVVFDSLISSLLVLNESRIKLIFPYPLGDPEGRRNPTDTQGEPMPASNAGEGTTYTDYNSLQVYNVLGLQVPLFYERSYENLVFGRVVLFPACLGIYAGVYDLFVSTFGLFERWCFIEDFFGLTRKERAWYKSDRMPATFV
jgi:hypothetical protein